MTNQELVNKILTENGLDFNIAKLPLFAMQNGSPVPSPYFGLMNEKTNEIIHSVRGGYTVSQNKEIVEMVVAGLKPFGDKLSVTKAGSLNGGRKVFLQLSIEGESKVGNDTIKKYVTIIDSNDGSTGLGVGIGNLTMSCQNQFFKFYRAGQSKFKHTESIEKRIMEIPDLIENALSQTMQIINQFSRFESTPVSRELAHKLVKHLLGVDKKTSSIKELADMSTRATNMMDALYTNIEGEMNSKGNNVWGLFSGVTRWTTFEKAAPKRDNGRLESIMTGNNYATNQKAFNFAMELVG